MRPLSRRGADKGFPDRPHERALVAFLFAAGAAALATRAGDGAAQCCGLLLAAATTVLLLGRLLLKSEPDALGQLRRVAALAVVGGLFLFFVRVARDTQRLSFALLPLPTLSILLALLLSPRFALLFGALLTALAALVARGATGSGEALLMLGAGSLAGALYAFRVRRPSRLLAIGVIVAAAHAVLLLVNVLLRGEPVASHDFAVRLLRGAAHGVATGLLALGLLPLFEKLLDRLADVTLLEYSNQNEQPVLRRLQVEAPGTHHHSFMVGTLAEAGAEAIGANGLLCRVGAYFHDIGKMNKPEYFSENSPEARALHAAMSPDMSKLVITAHAKDGIELADHYRIPRPIQAFIEEHHGTTAVEYFWRKAMLQRGEDEVPKESYRYPGPRPQTKETAVVMIADSVEAASRTIKEVTPQRIEQLIDDIVRMKMDDRQLDECTLTMRELTRVKEAFLQVLIGVHHRRPAYPRDPTGRLAVPLAEVELVPEIETGRAPEPSSDRRGSGRAPPPPPPSEG